MPNPANDELPYQFRLKDDGLWLTLGRQAVQGYEGSLIHLCPPEDVDQVMEAMSQFLAEHDYGERMDEDLDRLTALADSGGSGVDLAKMSTDEIRALLAKEQS